jgi:hypothetical protein
MKAAETLPTLRMFAPAGQAAYGPNSKASAWAIERITGEAAPPATPVQRSYSDWFLFPQR